MKLLFIFYIRRKGSLFKFRVIGYLDFLNVIPIVRCHNFLQIQSTQNFSVIISIFSYRYMKSNLTTHHHHYFSQKMSTDGQRPSPNCNLEQSCPSRIQWSPADDLIGPTYGTQTSNAASAGMRSVFRTFRPDRLSVSSHC